MDKVRKYIKPVMIRLDERIFLDLKEKCKVLEMNEAVYCRKAVEKCLKRNCIKPEK
jgi:hypothetical protein